MQPDAIRTHAPKVLTAAQREAGFLYAEGQIPYAWLQRLTALSQAFVDESRRVTAMPAPMPTSHTGDIVRGSPATIAYLDSFLSTVPPDWSKLGYGSIFVAQKAEM
jgi:hypothetical protein